MALPAPIRSLYEAPEDLVGLFSAAYGLTDMIRLFRTGSFAGGEAQRVVAALAALQELQKQAEAGLRAHPLFGEYFAQS